MILFILAFLGGVLTILSPWLGSTSQVEQGLLDRFRTGPAALRVVSSVTVSASNAPILTSLCGSYCLDQQRTSREKQARCAAPAVPFEGEWKYGECGI